MDSMLEGNVPRCLPRSQQGRRVVSQLLRNLFPLRIPGPNLVDPKNRRFLLAAVRGNGVLIEDVPRAGDIPPELRSVEIEDEIYGQSPNPRHQLRPRRACQSRDGLARP